MILQLDPPLPVTVTAAALPPGVRSTSRRGWCYAWQSVGVDGHRLWVVALDDTGEVVDVPQPEILMDFNWSLGRRPPRP